MNDGWQMAAAACFVFSAIQSARPQARQLVSTLRLRLRLRLRGCTPSPSTYLDEHGTPGIWSRSQPAEPTMRPDSC